MLFTIGPISKHNGHFFRKADLVTYVHYTKYNLAPTDLS